MTLEELNSKFMCDPPEVKNNAKVIIEIDDKYYEVTDCTKDYLVIEGDEVPVVILSESNFEKVTS